MVNFVLGMTVNTSLYPYGPPDICPQGLLLPLVDERSWDITLRTVVYFLGLLYFFLGVAMVTDIFMSSIETITSKTRKIYMSKTGGNSKKVFILYNLIFNEQLFITFSAYIVIFKSV